MNTHSPLIPQGSLIAQKNDGRARFRIAVLFVLAVHGVGLVALLMAGCRRDEGSGPGGETTNAPPAFVEPTNPPVVAEPVVPVPASNPAPVVVEPTPPTQPVPAPPPSSAQEYTIAKGDSFTTIGKKFGVSAKEIADANPGVDSTKLKIGAKLHIPAATTTAAGAPAGAEPSNGGQTYTVKSGDTLSKIAKDHGTNIKSLRAANNLKTDRITVGQKLKLPGKAAAGSPSTEPAGTAAPMPPGAEPVPR